MKVFYVILKKTNGFHETIGPTAPPFDTYEKAEEAAAALAAKHSNITFDVFCVASRHQSVTEVKKEMIDHA